jgi:hypothetical protein
MACQNLEKCPIPLHEGVGAIYRKRYCESNWEECARLAVFRQCGPSHVPQWLKPNMNPEADDIIARVQASD